MRRAAIAAGLALVVACGDDASVGPADGSSSTSAADATGASTTGTSGTTIGSSTSGGTTSLDGSDTAGSSGRGSESSSGTDSGGGGPIFEMCFADDFVNDPDFGPQYEQFGPVINRACWGTNHQDIAGVQRVVFLGDSITVGTPPTPSADYYRSLLADQLAAEFGLVHDAETLWKLVDPFNGTSVDKFSGDFASCAKWGARNDDLLEGGAQLEECFPPESRMLTTLVVVTSGGNDLSAITQAAIDGASEDELWAMFMQMVELKRQAVHWLVDDPTKFPNGVFVIFGNLYEFTDGTGEVESCDVSGLAGFDQPVPAPEQLAEMVVWTEEQYMQIAVETGTDMVLMLENFCGHGFNADDPMAPCYRGPGTEVWFDLTCIHPNPTGHAALADGFMSVVLE